MAHDGRENVDIQISWKGGLVEWRPQFGTAMAEDFWRARSLVGSLLVRAAGTAEFSNMSPYLPVRTLLEAFPCVSISMLFVCPLATVPVISHIHPASL